LSGKVVGVTDGDTITVMHGQVGEKIRETEGEKVSGTVN